MAAVEAVGDPQDRRQLLDHRPQVRVQALPVLVRLLRALPLVVARDRRDDLDLLGGEARQVAVRDQVVGMLLVPGEPDGAADVVQERPVLEPLPLGRRQLVEGVRLVEELERQPRDVRGMEDLGVGAAQEPVHAPRPDVPVAGALLPMPRRRSRG